MIADAAPLRCLSVLVPIYNERATVERLLRAVVAVETGLELEVLACDDGSTDGTRDILRDLTLPGLRVIFLDRNVGRGGVLKHLWTIAKGDVIVHQDADLEYAPDDSSGVAGAAARRHAPMSCTAAASRARSRECAG